MKEVKESLLEKLCKDDLLITNTVRRSNSNFKQINKQHSAYNSIQKQGALSKSPVPSPRPRFLVQRNNVRLVEDPRINEDFTDTRNSGNYETRQKKHLNVYSPMFHPRAYTHLPIAQKKTPSDADHDEEQYFEDIDLHSDCVGLQEYRELKDKYKKWLNENKVLLKRIHFLEHHLKWA